MGGVEIACKVAGANGSESRKRVLKGIKLASGGREKAEGKGFARSGEARRGAVGRAVPCVLCEMSIFRYCSWSDFNNG